MTNAAAIQSSRDQLLSTSGDAATLTHGGVTSEPFAIIFDEEYQDLLGVSTSNVAALAKTEDVSSAIRDDTLTVTSTLYAKTAVAYEIEERRPNPPDAGPGFTRLILKQ